MKDLLESLNKPSNLLYKIAGAAAVILAIANLWGIYKNNFWEPVIEVVDVDYDKGIAHLKIHGQPFLLKGNSTYHIRYDWGIQFGTTNQSEGSGYDRIEIVKNGMVQRIIK